jgi:hypothetical protein
MALDCTGTSPAVMEPRVTVPLKIHTLPTSLVYLPQRMRGCRLNKVISVEVARYWHTSEVGLVQKC